MATFSTLFADKAASDLANDSAVAGADVAAAFGTLNTTLSGLLATTTKAFKISEYANGDDLTSNATPAFERLFDAVDTALASTPNGHCHVDIDTPCVFDTELTRDTLKNVIITASNYGYLAKGTNNNSRAGSFGLSTGSLTTAACQNVIFWGVPFFGKNNMRDGSNNVTTAKKGWLDNTDNFFEFKRCDGVLVTGCYFANIGNGAMRFVLVAENYTVPGGTVSYGGSVRIISNRYKNVAQPFTTNDSGHANVYFAFNELDDVTNAGKSTSKINGLQNIIYAFNSIRNYRSGPFIQGASHFQVVHNTLYDTYEAADADSSNPGYGMICTVNTASTDDPHIVGGLVEGNTFVRTKTLRFTGDTATGAGVNETQLLQNLIIRNNIILEAQGQALTNLDNCIYITGKLKSVLVEGNLIEPVNNTIDGIVINPTAVTADTRDEDIVVRRNTVRNSRAPLVITTAAGATRYMRRCDIVDNDFTGCSVFDVRNIDGLRFNRNRIKGALTSWLALFNNAEFILNQIELLTGTTVAGLVPRGDKIRILHNNITGLGVGIQPSSSSGVTNIEIGWNYIRTNGSSFRPLVVTAASNNTIRIHNNTLWQEAASSDAVQIGASAVAVTYESNNVIVAGTKNINWTGIVNAQKFTLDVPSIAAGGTSVQTVALAAATVGDFVDITVPIDLQGLVLNRYVSSAGNVALVFYNPTAGAIDLANNTNWYVERRARPF